MVPNIRKVIVPVGSTVRLPIKLKTSQHIGGISCANRSIAAYKIIGQKSLKITGLCPGKTVLSMWICVNGVPVRRRIYVIKVVEADAE
ncbi:pilus assembly protein N-terminal domain-containing protein [Paenibacillus turpanensis]|uniref:pilus assembly protein N-terminal domain-containing protein n=1 Tax=Paenibacillus turpanensis TaxID=2689078 RepID=UPI00140B5BF5|nr:pilus assembly protein N-terminal domain-containing protein [Paenibacillus turpanensis]